MKWYVWLILFISVSLILGLFQKLKNERLIEEGPIETKVDISKLKPIDYPDIPITPHCTPKTVTTTVQVEKPVYVSDKKCEADLVVAVSANRKLQEELEGANNTISNLINSCKK